VPVVLVHGLGLSGRSLLPLAARLAADRPVYVPDLPGYGRSQKPPAAADVPELADALAGWMAVAGTGRSALLGHSMGCQVIVDLALHHPALADRLVLVGPSTDPAAPTVLGQAWRALGDLPGEPLSFWPVLLADYLTAGPLRVLRALRLLLRDPLREKLPRLTQPVLVVRGANDPIAPQRWAEEVCRLAPRAGLVVLPRAAHAAPYGAPGAVARAVRPFLGGDDGKGP
jgi:pimeloyl-ACP methyl ester carboxylesterase